MFLGRKRDTVRLSRKFRRKNPGAVPPIETAVPGAYGVRGTPLGRAPFQVSVNSQASVHVSINAEPHDAGCHMDTVGNAGTTSSEVGCVRAEALFASPLQRSDNPTRDQVRAAVTAYLSQHGPRECACQLAQEYGDHPTEAALRMSWALAQVESAFAPGATRLPTRDRSDRNGRAATETMAVAVL
jgi:hypothetical protein